MSSIFVNEQNKLRNGWKILLFIITFAISIAVVSSIFSLFFPIYDFIISEIIVLVSVIISSFIMMRSLEKESLLNIGLKFKSGTTYEIVLGLILGFLMITVVVLPNIILGYYRFDLAPNRIIPQIFEAILFFTLVAFAEEILFRGYPFQRLIDGTNPTIATLIFSFVFSLAHFQNPNINVIAGLNIFLAGIWLSVSYIKTRSLWLPISLHFSWNFFQGYLYSLPVSGTTLIEPIFDVEIAAENLISGGDFGPEGSLLTSLVLVISTVFIIKNPRFSNEQIS